MKKNTNRKKVSEISAKKNKEKVVVLTAYDYPMALLLDEAGVDIILVGDSLANVVLGLESTREVGMDEMLHHAKAVSRAVKNSMVVGDMPFSSYQTDPAAAVKNARRFVDEAGCDAIKLEWFDKCPEVTEAIVKAGIPVMGHIGLTPQTADKLGGFKVQGKDADSARQLINHARELEKKGCFAIVLECIPDKIAGIITSELKVPTIGIGAGVQCDGQVLVTHDLLGLAERFHPKFVKQYVALAPLIVNVIKQFRNEVLGKQFPDNKHSYSISEEEVGKLKQHELTG